MKMRSLRTAILLLLPFWSSGGAGAQPAHAPALEGPAYDYDWGPAGFEIRFRKLDPAVLVRLVEKKPSRDEWVSLCAVRAYFGKGEIPGDLPALIGSYEVRGDTLAFRPRYRLNTQTPPLIRCLLDTSLWKQPSQLPDESDDPQNPGKIRIDLDLRSESPKPPTAPSLDRVYPSSDLLPENLLKFYLHFSAPMSRGEAYKHIRLLDASGKAIADPFLELDEELWSTDGKRFTLLFDPGRIKRGLKPREEVGPVLEQGKSYTLVVDKEWPSARGVPLAGAVRRSLRVGPPDETSPAPASWKIDPPEAGTTAPLTVRFPEPLDHALAERLISVRDPQGQLLRGQGSLTEKETLWTIGPGREPWKPGEYRLEIGTEL